MFFFYKFVYLNKYQILIRRTKKVKGSCILNNHVFNNTVLFYDSTTLYKP